MVNILTNIISALNTSIGSSNIILSIPFVQHTKYLCPTPILKSHVHMCENIVNNNWLLKGWNDAWDHGLLCSSESLWCPFLPFQACNINFGSPCMWHISIFANLRFFCHRKNTQKIYQIKSGCQIRNFTCERCCQR